MLVDNAFAAPAAHDCTLLLPGLGLIDPIINLQAGLPSPAGTNEAVQEADGAIVQPHSPRIAGLEERRANVARATSRIKAGVQVHVVRSRRSK